MTDITHSNVFTNNDTVPRLRRILDEEPTQSARATDHEVAPYVPAPDRTACEKVADQSIGVVDEAASMVLAKYQELKDQIAEGEQMILSSQVEVRDTIRSHMKIVEMAIKTQQLIAQQIADANKLLRNGK